MELTRNLVRDQRYQNSENKIYRAIEEVITERSSDKITVSGICRLAKIRRSTFYRHFSGIEEAIAAHLEHTIDELQRALSRIMERASFEMLFYLIFTHFARHHKLYAQLLDNWDFSYFHQIALTLKQVVIGRWLEIQPKLTQNAQEQLFDVFTFRLIQELKAWQSIDEMVEDKIPTHARRLTNQIERLPRRQFDVSLSAIF
ncbi:TetR family transcriptional regulator [Candidatus Saccharibacteria bacterium]|nr:TetR family transcriptional regulator [Candidatus Saccharibacteria bacterium]